MRVVVLALIAGPAAAAVQPCYLDQAVQEAVTVVQVVDQRVTRPDAAGLCALEGTAARSFRGAVPEGAPVRVAFACANPDDLVGGTVYWGRSDVAAAGAVEVHMAAGGEVAGYGHGLMLLPAPTDAIAFPFEHLPAPGESC